MYHAICPDCKTVITLNVPGLIWADCPNCTFYGQVYALASATGPTPRLPRMPLAPTPTPMPTSPTPPSATTPRTLVVAGLDISAFAVEVAETFLASLLRAQRDQRDHHTSLTLPVAWERLQVALDGLHTALGGTHMGDYAPDADAVGAAIVGVTVAQLVALEAVGRLCGGASAEGE